MRISLGALGTRGDVEPAIALSKGLQAAGHEVLVVAGSNFEGWVRAHGLAFTPTLDMETLMKSPNGIAWAAEPNQFRQLGYMRVLLDEFGDQMAEPLIAASEGADLLLGGFVAEPYVQTLSERFRVPQINIPLQPYRATRSGPASLVSFFKRSDSPLNYLAGWLSEGLIWGVAAESVNRLRARLGLPPHNGRSYRRAAHQIPIVYGFSRHVVPPGTDWGAHQQVGGYWFLDEHPDWTPPGPLVEFLNAGDPPVYIGFGSMTHSDPRATFDLIVEALTLTGQRAIVLRGWAGLDAEDAPDNVYLIDGAPHRWLFEQVAGVVHHGGAGTTAASLRAGRPTQIIPHMADQPYWGDRVAQIGVGPKALPLSKLTAAKLARGIRRLMDDESMRARAARLGEQIRAEDGVANSVRIIERYMREYFA